VPLEIQQLTIKLSYVPMEVQQLNIKLSYVPLEVQQLTIRLSYVPLEAQQLTIKLSYVPLEVQQSGCLTFKERCILHAKGTHFPPVLRLRCVLDSPRITS
jgi:hypothetical protein